MLTCPSCSKPALLQPTPSGHHPLWLPRLYRDSRETQPLLKTGKDNCWAEGEGQLAIRSKAVAHASVREPCCGAWAMASQEEKPSLECG